MTVEERSFPTEVVGSYPQPGWLVDREYLRRSPPPRVKAKDIWKVEPALLKEAQDDATILAIGDMEKAGVDIITDGEVRRESYSVTFASALDGMDSEHPGETVGRSGRTVRVPRVVGPIRWRESVLASDAEFLRRHTKKKTKMTIPGPFTVTRQAKNEYYKDELDFALAVAAAVNQEAKAVKSRGIDVIQLDEPYLQQAPDKAESYGAEAINAALEGVEGTTVVHTCFGYGFIIKDKPKGYPFLEGLNQIRAEQISVEAAQPGLDPAILAVLDKTVILGVLDLGDSRVETPKEVEARAKAALEHIPAERLILAPDCGMKYLDRDVAYGKLASMVRAAASLREELS